MAVQWYRSRGEAGQRMGVRVANNVGVDVSLEVAQAVRLDW
jgi:hypothetical protein